MRAHRALHVFSTLRPAPPRPAPPRPAPPRPLSYLVLSMDQPGQVALDLHAKDLGALGPAKNWLALGILVAMLVAIASERVHRM
jgi:hypothetical protein